MTVMNTHVGALPEQAFNKEKQAAKLAPSFFKYFIL